MWTVEVVVVEPGVELEFSFGGVLAGAGIGAFSKC